MKGKIYKITSGDLTYYGSTTSPLSRRLSQHRYDCKKKPTLSANTVLSNGDYKIELIEELEFENKKEMREREGYYIQNFNCVNTQTAGLSRKDSQKKYRDSEKGKLKTKEYLEKNKERISELKKNYRKIFNDMHPDYNKKYYEDKKKELLEKQKIYYEKNKERILERNRKYKLKIKNKPILLPDAEET